MMTIADKKHLQSIIDRKAKADTFRQYQEKKWIRLYKLQRLYLDESQHPWRSNIFPPAPHYVLETYLPYIISEIFGRRPWVQPLPRGREDIENAKHVELLLDYQLQKEKAFRKFVCWVKEALVYGVGIRQLRWNRQLGQPEIVEVDIADFWKDPTTVAIKDSEFCFRRIGNMTVEELAASKSPEYRNLKYLAKEGAGGVRDAVRVQREAVAEIDTSKEGHEIWQCWTDYGRTVSWVADGNLIIGGPKDNPFNHKNHTFHKIGCIPIQHEFYDMGLLEPCEGLFYEKAHIRNQRTDARNLACSPIFEVYRGARIKQHQMITKPGKWILSDFPGQAIKPIQFDWRIFATSMQEEANIDAEIFEGSGARPPMAGAETGRRETATAHLEMKAASLMRVTLINMLAEETLEHFFEQYMQLNHQFLNKKVMLRLVDPISLDEAMRATNFLDLDPSMIRGSYDFKFYSAALRPKEVDRKQFLELLTVLGQTGLLGAILNGSINQNRAAQKLLEEIVDRFEFKNKSVFLEEATEEEGEVELEQIPNLAEATEPMEGLGAAGPTPETMDIFRRSVG